MIALKTSRACGHCPVSVLCMQDNLVSVKPSKALRYCTRCACLHINTERTLINHKEQQFISPLEANTYICGLIRQGEGQCCTHGQVGRDAVRIAIGLQAPPKPADAAVDAGFTAGMLGYRRDTPKRTRRSIKTTGCSPSFRNPHPYSTVPVLGAAHQRAGDFAEPTDMRDCFDAFKHRITEVW